MPSLIDLMLEGRKIRQHSPWPRFVVDAHHWKFAAGELAQGGWSLLGLWGEPTTVHMAVIDRDTAEVAVISLDCPSRVYPSVSQHHPPAIRLERTINDLFGLTAEDLPDARPWLDHNRWGVRFPLSDRIDALSTTAPYRFLAAEGDGMHQIAVGPVHAGIIEPGHFRFTASGETVVRLEQRLGYTHKGIEGLMRGASVERCAELAGRVSGDSTVAYAWSYAQAVECIAETAAPLRAAWLRALCLERERLANHLGDLGALGNDGGFAFGLAQFSRLRENMLRTNAAAFGHRLLMDVVVPGGIAQDLALEHVHAMHDEAHRTRREITALRNIYDEHAGLQDRFRTAGRVSPELATKLGLLGLAARASGVARDVRCDFPSAPYDALAVRIAVQQDGDVAARVAVRFDEALESARLIAVITAALLDPQTSGEIRSSVGDVPEGRLAVGYVEGWRGPILTALESGGNGTIRRCHPQDPSWSNWPVLEHAVIGNIVPDFPLINKSFNLSYSGHDL